ncbi:inosine-5'-monophosphate dehydrogenase [bacterium BMS3Bbin03]|nr:inosine-5'-monophosphate dehydrogenase [bacterium BMS3Bbin03]
MLVKNYMKTDVISVKEDDSFNRVVGAMKEYHIRHIPVVEKGKVVGIVTESDIKKASASPATTLSVYELNYLLEKIKAKDIMTRAVKTAAPELSLEDAAMIMRERKIGGLPVVDDRNSLLGIITLTDIIDVFLDVMGVGARGIRLTIEAEDKPGQIYEMAAIIKKYDVNIISLVAPRHQDPKMRKIVMRIQCTKQADTMISELEKAGFVVLSLIGCDP